VIRFKCPNCGRYYEVPPSLRHVPLLCKGCGQRIAVPEDSEVPGPVPEPQIAIAPTGKLSIPASATPTPGHQPSEKEQLPKTLPPAENAAVGETQPGAQPEKNAWQQASTTQAGEDDEKTQSSFRLKPRYILVDVAVGLLFLLIGGTLGAFLAGSSTAEIWAEAGSATKFPPMDLLLWLAPPTMLLLIYSLLIARRKSLGAWLQRKSGK
jgi:hypothetical protein